MPRRRTVLGGLGTLALLTPVAGCLGDDGGNGDDGSDGGTTSQGVPGEVVENEVPETEVVDLTGQPVETGEGSAFRVSGAVENGGGSTVNFREVRATLLDAGGSELTTEKEFGFDRLHPGSSVPFEVTTTSVDPGEVARYEVAVLD